MSQDCCEGHVHADECHKGHQAIRRKGLGSGIQGNNQLNDMTVFGKVNPDMLSPEQKRKALCAINLIKEKRCGKIKGRTVADGRPQRNYIPREEATSPTVSMESLMASLAIGAHERRDVAIFDVPGAYSNAHMPDNKFVLLKLEWEFVDTMCKSQRGIHVQCPAQIRKKAFVPTCSKCALWLHRVGTVVVRNVRVYPEEHGIRD
jgi:hypothetical protein